MSFGRRLVGEGIATALLLATVVGSGIMGERLAAGDSALALLAFGPISGAHLNPVVTLTEAWRGGMTRVDAAGYVAAQIVGALVGVVALCGERVR